MKISVIIASVIMGASLIISSTIISYQINVSTNKVVDSITNLEETKVNILGGIGVTQREPIKW